MPAGDAWISITEGAFDKLEKEFQEMKKGSGKSKLLSNIPKKE